MQDFRMNTFLEVCKTLNFTSAARNLCITQPAVTQHIQYLENAYGVQLFERNGRKITLTPAGKMLQDAAITMKHDEMKLTEEMQQVDSRKSYVFGATQAVAEYMLADALPELRSNHPKSRIEMQVGNTTELRNRLDDGIISFAIVEGTFPKSEYEWALLDMRHYVAAASTEIADRLAGCTVQELFSETLITREEGSGTREILERELAARGFTIDAFEDMIELGSIGAIKQMLQNNLGITFIYRAAIDKEIEEGTLAVIKLKDFDVKHEICFIFRKNSIFEDEYMEVYNEIFDVLRRRHHKNSFDMMNKGRRL
ncbi:MAG: LysR substrate-binding domain-containing protein [Coriobacteriales bacterium]|jgi:DNA-binding transcriptional LysR family regulator